MSVTDGRRSVPLGIGGVAGVLAWLLGYLLTFAVAAGRIEAFRGSFLGRVAELFGLEIPTWKVVGWVFYNAHFVDTVAGGGSGSAIGGDGFTPLLYVVPPLVLVAAGLAVGRATDTSDTPDAANAALAGATVVGYLPLSVVGVLLFEATVVGTTVGPSLVPGVVLAGVLYPAVFGAFGAGVAALTGGDGANDARRL